MAREHNDAWTRLPPLDRLAGALSDPPETGSIDPRATLRFSAYLKGTQAIFVIKGGDDEIEVKFRYRRRAAAWQMFRREGNRWIADGLASEHAGRILEQIVLVMQGADPKEVFE